jgi:UDP-glucuronate 4-epimerase
MLNDEPISVYGDGSTSRDYTYINDIIKGVIAAIDYDKTGFEIINLGNNKTVTLAELIEAIETTCGKKALIKNLPQQPGDVLRTYANISKAKDLLGYNPATNLEEGLEKFYAWFKNNRSILQ